MAVIRSSDLDFDTIKANLKTFLQASTEFADYDFDASGLNNILDVLAFNTHINGLTANFAINESFLKSAQLRSSIVAHAETLGYYAASKTASSSVVNITAATSDTTTTSATLPVNTEFTGVLGDTSFTFQTTEAFTATNDGSGNFTFKDDNGLSNITIKEGTRKTKTFIVGEVTEGQTYVIPDVNVDKRTLSVQVFDTTTSSTFTTFTDVENAVRIDSTSTVFIIRETPNGFYEIFFGEGNVLGKNPVSGNKIVVTYIAPTGADANGISAFTADSTLTIGSTTVTPTVTVVSNSAGGSEKESLESIKLNAPLVFASQQRLVTAEDYRAIIQQRFSSVIEAVAAWGGEDNIPKDIGSVYLSIDFKDGITADVQSTTKDAIRNNVTDNLAIMSIDTEFVDPINALVEISVKFYFDPDLTSTTLDTMQENVKTAVTNFFTDNLGTFNKSFRKSALITTIDAVSPAVLNSSISVKVQRSFTPTLNTSANYTIDFPMLIASPDDTSHIITSSFFTLDGQTCILRNRLQSTTIEVFDNVNNVVLIDNVGTYSETNGTIELVGFGRTLTAFSGSAIDISAVPANQETIKPLRQYILSLDVNKNTALGTVDNQNTETTLTV